jgi:chlorophyll synthase
MLGAQVVVVAALASWGLAWAAASVAALMAAQIGIMVPFLRSPVEGQALRVSAFGVPFYVLGMMLSAVALGGVA